MSQALLREIKTTIKNYKLYNYLPVNCRTIGGPISGGKRQERRPCIHLINNMENPSTSARQLLNSDLVIVMTLLEKRNNCNKFAPYWPDDFATGNDIPLHKKLKKIKIWTRGIGLKLHTCEDPLLHLDYDVPRIDVHTEVYEREHGNVHEDALDQQRSFVVAAKPSENFQVI